MLFIALFQIFPLQFSYDGINFETHKSLRSIELLAEAYRVLEKEDMDTLIYYQAAAIRGRESEIPSYTIPENVPANIEKLLVRYSAKYDLPIDVVVRLSEVESNHGRHRQSLVANFDGSVDIGVLALNSGYIDYFANRYYEGRPSDFDPYNDEHNIQTGLAYLAHLKQLTGDISSAVIAYNCGYQSMKRGEIPQSTQRYAKAIVHGEPL